MDAVSLLLEPKSDVAQVCLVKFSLLLGCHWEIDPSHVQIVQEIVQNGAEADVVLG